MFDVFTEEIEVLIKEGIANLYWFKKDLNKAMLRSGVSYNLADRIQRKTDDEGRKLSKRQQMDLLYDSLRNHDFNRRLEVSRNFVRILVEHKSFTPQDEKHRIEKAEKAALKLKDVIRNQQKDQEYKESVRRKAAKAQAESYHDQLLSLRNDFVEYNEMKPQERGYALEKIFPRLMQISSIPVQESFKITGEQIDGGIKYDGHYYLVELKWHSGKIGPSDIGSFYYKVDGKLDARGIIVSMNGFTDGVVDGLPQGRKLKVILLDGVHLSSVIFGNYTFSELMEHCVSHAAYKSNLYAPHAITQT